ncbi:hypothetical protein M430DRAFT_32756 [Amorphotheca resinae ATCC 22711]|jgi:hypothetical protein|uniref:Uncharacterized protein n=1 Tax=Amorphotheca resinae ATCC 22711 TaxID=857342 RepID=A0A2T3BG88_AMORE|nr:hypothetical protein M430DRAFT_32756 [Amorphotheca resinae ATCC 22711]PSS28343.1 hypothetical protein M430DRAFT_32756 [Amorphotheca resinae ATCC 22711]
MPPQLALNPTRDWIDRLPHSFSVIHPILACVAVLGIKANMEKRGIAGEGILQVWFLLFYSCLGLLSMLGYFNGYFSQTIVVLDEEASLTEWVDCVRTSIRNWIWTHEIIFNYVPDGEEKAAQHEMENFAAYLADPSPCQVRPPQFSRRWNALTTVLFWAVTCYLTQYTFLLYQSGVIFDGVSGPATCFLVFIHFGILMFVAMMYPAAKKAGRDHMMGVLGRRIRKQCIGSDEEKGGLSMREQLAWFIGELLKEEDDSEGLARERRKVIINPIVKQIRCPASC